MSLTGATIYLHNWREPMAKRLASRKHCGPYMWTVTPPGRGNGRGYYASDEDGTPGDGGFSLRACERPRGASCYSHDGHDTFSPVVLRLPRSRGFLAGYTLGEGMASSVGATIYEDEDDAWRAAGEEARVTCENEADYRAEQEDDEDDEDDEDC